MKDPSLHNTTIGVTFAEHICLLAAMRSIYIPLYYWCLYIYIYKYVPKLYSSGIFHNRVIVMVADGRIPISPATGDFTKHGQPVPRPDPTWRFGIAHLQLWEWKYLSCALTVPFCQHCIDAFSRGEVINSMNPRDAYVHHWPRSPWTQLIAWYLLGAKSLPEPILIYNQLHP